MKAVRLLALVLLFALASLAAKPAESVTTCTAGDYQCWCNKECEDYFFYCVANCRYDPNCGFSTCSDDLCYCRYYNCHTNWPGCPTYE